MDGMGLDLDHCKNGRLFQKSYLLIQAPEVWPWPLSSTRNGASEGLNGLVFFMKKVPGTPGHVGRNTCNI